MMLEYLKGVLAGRPYKPGANGRTLPAIGEAAREAGSPSLRKKKRPWRAKVSSQDPEMPSDPWTGPKTGRRPRAKRKPR